MSDDLANAYAHRLREAAEKFIEAADTHRAARRKMLVKRDINLFPEAQRAAVAYEAARNDLLAAIGMYAVLQAGPP
jgi:IS4 transposase